MVTPVGSQKMMCFGGDETPVVARAVVLWGQDDFREKRQGQ